MKVTAPNSPLPIAMASRVVIPMARSALIRLPSKQFNRLSSPLPRLNNLQHKWNVATTSKTKYRLGFRAYATSVKASGALNREAEKDSTSFREVDGLFAATDEAMAFNGLNGPESLENWTIKMLYDGECPLCMREVRMLQERNKAFGTIKFVDISALNYLPDDNGGITFEMAMGRIHAILKDGTILQNVEAFKRLYEEVGLGWVYAITNYEPFSSIAESLYNIWAKYRLPLTG
ncbi:hypothetical protein O6H91_16G061800 [Diphasiastrum complanatum]|nr:hypothetical protein O6H91_Y352900 [Diphasiastrum complanatum]KAJ7527582.1 hypothetical protein O6H91_16G061800 [Diphasiastrum complanatum]